MYKQMSEAQRLQFITVLLCHSASDLLDTLTPEQKDTWDHFKTAFMARFGRSQRLLWRDAWDIWSQQQGQDESAEDIISKITRRARRLPNMDETMLRYAIIHGLKGQIRTQVLQANVQTMAELLHAAKVADAAQPSTADPNLKLLLDEIRKSNNQHADHRAAFEQLTGRLNHLHVSSVGQCGNRAGSRSPRRVPFAEQRTPSPEPERRPFPPQRRRRGQQTPQRIGRSPHHPAGCYRCGKSHRNQPCPAQQAQCGYCSRIGHYMSVCLQRRDAARRRNNY